jgi:hypothetical protein
MKSLLSFSTSFLSVLTGSHGRKGAYGKMRVLGEGGMGAFAPVLPEPLEKEPAREEVY